MADTVAVELTYDERSAINEAAVELSDIAKGLKNQSADWFHGGATLVDYYERLSQRLDALAKRANTAAGVGGGGNG